MALIRCNNESAINYNATSVTNSTGTLLTSGTPHNVIKGNLYALCINGSSTDSFTFTNGSETITTPFAAGGQYAAVAFVAKADTVTYTGNVGSCRIVEYT